MHAYNLFFTTFNAKANNRIKKVHYRFSNLMQYKKINAYED